MLAVVPAEGLTVAFLANRSDLVPEEIVQEVLLAMLVPETGGNGGGG